MYYPISLEVNENSSSDLANQDKQQACEILWVTKKKALINELIPNKTVSAGNQ